MLHYRIALLILYTLPAFPLIDFGWPGKLMVSACFADRSHLARKNC